MLDEKRIEVEETITGRYCIQRVCDGVRAARRSKNWWIGCGGDASRSSVVKVARNAYRVDA